MTLNDLIRWGQGIRPEADETVLPSISTTVLSKKDIFNEAASEFVKITKCFPKEKQFNCTANNYTYSLSSNIPNYMEMREEGVWHNQSNTWTRLKPTTVRELDQTFPTWRNQSSSDQVRNYWVDGDILGTFYTPSTTVANGLQVYYYANSSDMTLSTQYPFTGTTTEDPRLKNYEKYLLAYYEGRVLGLLGYKDDAQVKLQEFYQLCTKAKSELQSRRDLTQDAQAKPKTALRFGNPFR